MLKQISIFAENKKGMLQSVTGILARENINIMGSVTNDRAEYGIIRMVVTRKGHLMHFQKRALSAVTQMFWVWSWMITPVLWTGF